MRPERRTPDGSSWTSSLPNSSGATSRGSRAYNGRATTANGMPAVLPDAGGVGVHAAGEAVQLCRYRVRSAAARGGAARHRAARLQQGAAVGAQIRVGLDQLGQRDVALQAVAD